MNIAETNADRVRRGYAAFNARDGELLLLNLHAWDQSWSPALPQHSCKETKR